MYEWKLGLKTRNFRKIEFAILRENHKIDNKGEIPGILQAHPIAEFLYYPENGHSDNFKNRLLGEFVKFQEFTS